MSTTPLKIWCNAAFVPSLAEMLAKGVSPHQLIWSGNSQKSNLASVGTDPAARSADILFGQPHPDDVIHSKTVRWVHLTTAGYTRYDNDAVRNAMKSRGAILTNSSSAFADPCAEHLLAFMLCAARELPEAILNDAGKHEWPYLEMRERSRLLKGQSATLIGFGAIGRRMVELLTPFHMRLSAVRRSVRGNESIRTFTVSQLDEAVRDVDHVINILPAAESTKQIFNAARFAKMKRGTIFYNIGRGDTVDQDALCDALESGHLRAAYLDVTTPEPLPPEHRLWRAPNCWITPHVAGGHEMEFRANLEHFLDNFKRYLRSEAMADRIV